MSTEKTASFKFAMLSGALKNAGDFLIVKRSEELVRHIYPNAELSFYNRCKNLEPYLDEISQTDALIFCGGPAYIPQLYPQAFPLVSDLNLIRVPMFALGLGWFGSSSAYKAVYNYRLQDSSIKLLKRIEQDTGVLGCRDWYSVSVLRSNQIWSGVMTGCPAWYNLEFISLSDFSAADPAHPKKLCISDPADPGYLEQMLDIAAYARQLFPKAEIKAVFHRGIQADCYTDSQTAQLISHAVSELLKMNIACTDISYGENGFSVYDDCDLHIGFRVHAHIYNLSRRNISVLIEEDGRGAGVNRALGLENITAYDYAVKSRPEGERVISTVGKKANTYLLQAVDDYINSLYQSGFLQIKNAYRMMQSYYQKIEQHVSSLCKYI